MFNGKIHYKSPFSIAMLVYQRVAFGMKMNPNDRALSLHRLQTRIPTETTSIDQQSTYLALFCKDVTSKGHPAKKNLTFIQIQIQIQIYTYIISTIIYRYINR